PERTAATLFGDVPAHRGGHMAAAEGRALALARPAGSRNRRERRRLMLTWRTLAFYIARQFLLWCFVVFLTMATIVFLLDYVELMRRGGSHPDAPLMVLLEMAALKQPRMWQQIMPFAILFGAMLSFWRMTRSNELVVARSTGVSVWQFLAPAVLVAL